MTLVHRPRSRSPARHRLLSTLAGNSDSCVGPVLALLLQGRLCPAAQDSVQTFVQYKQQVVILTGGKAQVTYFLSSRWRIEARLVITLARVVSASIRPARLLLIPGSRQGSAQPDKIAWPCSIPVHSWLCTSWAFQRRVSLGIPSRGGLLRGPVSALAE